MSPSRKQGELLSTQNLSCESNHSAQELFLNKSQIKTWQKRIHRHQEHLFQGRPGPTEQGSLFKDLEQKSEFNPLDLVALPLSFWRWPKAPHNGPAIYLVMDHSEELNSHILLYVGETIAADQRWKGEHDCKRYLSAYTESLRNVGLKIQLTIRFWTDVPTETTKRRKVEQSLIQKWLPPFNKETSSRWNTPFTAPSL